MVDSYNHFQFLLNVFIVLHRQQCVFTTVSRIIGMENVKGAPHIAALPCSDGLLLLLRPDIVVKPFEARIPQVCAEL